MRTIQLHCLRTTKARADVCRVWIPAWLHLTFYIEFMRHGRPNIDFVATMITEILWVILSLISASIPTLMRIAKKFTTNAVSLGPTMISSRRPNRTKLTSLQRAKMKKTESTISKDGSMLFRPDKAVNETKTDTANVKAEGVSINSTVESHVGILRQVDFDVSSETQ